MVCVSINFADGQNRQKVVKPCVPLETAQKISFDKLS